ncbi:Glucuronoxylanase XynC precursor [compost metagenome]
MFISAYKGNNKVVIVAINRGTSATTQNFTLQNGRTSIVSSWVTDQNRNLAANANIRVNNNSFSAQLPAQSVTTFVAQLGSNLTSLDENIDEVVGENIDINYEVEDGDTTLVETVVEESNQED